MPAGQIVHVLNRGNARQTVFSGDDDFLRLLDETAAAHGVALLGWCLMPNQRCPYGNREIVQFRVTISSPQ